MCRDGGRITGRYTRRLLLWTKPMHEKACTKCGIVKPLDAFPIDNGRKAVIRSQCKVCRAAHERERHAAKMADSGREVRGAEIVYAVPLPRRRYDRCPHCRGASIIRDDDEQCCLACGWTEPRYRAIRSLEVA